MLLFLQPRKIGLEFFKKVARCNRVLVNYNTMTRKMVRGSSPMLTFTYNGANPKRSVPCGSRLPLRLVSIRLLDFYKRLPTEHSSRREHLKSN